MFLAYGEMEQRALKAEAKVEELKEKYRKQMEAKDKEIKNLKELKDTENKNKYTDKIEELQLQIKHLVKALSPQIESEDPVELYQKFGCAIDEKNLETKVGKHVRTASAQLSAVNEKLQDYVQTLQNAIDSNADWTEIKRNILRVNKMLMKIDSSLQHIENFYKLVLGIPAV